VRHKHTTGALLVVATRSDMSHGFILGISHPQHQLSVQQSYSWCTMKFENLRGVAKQAD
jgi:hypothetical protein